VTGLSPYLTHGIVSLPEVAAWIAQKHKLSYDDKLIFEFGWREFFQHVWSRVKHPDDILKDMRPANLWRGKYANALPADIREGRTGVPCIDAAVRQLYATGYLHNHARMWLASYCVHLRKVHWRVGADWLVAHLFDGDLPSNHLSWQWVAATFSSKPYLFNAQNVAKFAPQNAWKAWASPKTAIDLSYEQLDTMCRESADLGPEPGVHAAVQEPACLESSSEAFWKQIRLLVGIKSQEFATDLIVSKLKQAAADGATGVHTRVQLVHPWAMHETSAASGLRIGVVQLAAHAQHPWSARRWQFVMARMQQVCDVIWQADLQDLALLPHWPQRSEVHAQHTLFAGYRDILPKIATLAPAPRLFPNPEQLCSSFTRFYERAQREQRDFSKLL
jgi:deoxyribodipyrimidine photo-lyase